MIIAKRPPPLPPEDAALKAALSRLLSTKHVPKYVRAPATAWLAKHLARSDKEP